MTKREESWARVIAVGIVVTAITIVWDLHGSVKVQASQYACCAYRNQRVARTYGVGCGWSRDFGPLS